MGDTGSMRVSADFTTVPDEFAARAPETNLVDGVPVVSFPFYVEGLEPGMHYLHWELVDPDSIPVCGFEWIHWAVANVPVDALMFDFNDSKALQIPPDFSRAMPSMIPEALQGRNSSAGSMVGGTNPQVTMRYNGPQPRCAARVRAAGLGDRRTVAEPAAGLLAQRTAACPARSG